MRIGKEALLSSGSGAEVVGIMEAMLRPLAKYGTLAVSESSKVPYSTTRTLTVILVSNRFTYVSHLLTLGVFSQAVSNGQTTETTTSNDIVVRLALGLVLRDLARDVPAMAWESSDGIKQRCDADKLDGRSQDVLRKHYGGMSYHLHQENRG